MQFFFGILKFFFFSAASSLFAPKPTLNGAEKSTLGDFVFPTSTQGRIVPNVWGTVLLKGPNLAWYGNLRQEAVTERVRTGLFSKKTITKYYKYFLTIQFGLCNGPDVALRKIYINDERLWSGNLNNDSGASATVKDLDFFGGEDFGTGGMDGRFYHYNGSDTQNENTYLKKYQKIGSNYYKYRGFSYVVWDGYIGDTTNILPWSFEVQRIPDNLSLTLSTVNVYDANPAEVIYEALTNETWGLGIDSSNIDITNFQSVGEKLREEGNGFSYIMDRKMETYEFISEVESQINGVLFLDRVTEKWKINLIREDYDINLVPNINESNCIEISSFGRSSWEQTINEAKILYSNRADFYNENYAISQDMANKEIQEKVVSSEFKFNGVKSARLANELAERSILQGSRPTSKASLVVDRSFWNTQQGDILSWSNSGFGFNNFPVRVLNVDIGDLDNGEVRLDVIEDVFQTGTGFFSEPPVTEWQAPSITVEPYGEGNVLAFEAPRALITRDDFAPNLGGRIWFGATRTGDNNGVLGEAYLSGASSWASASSPIPPPSGNRPIGSTTKFLITGQFENYILREAESDGILIKLDDKSYDLFISGVENVPNEEIGVSLKNLALGYGREEEFVPFGSIDRDEFMSFSSYTDSGNGYVVLNTVTRGLLDTVPIIHESGQKIWFISEGGSISEDSYSLRSSTFGAFSMIPSNITTSLEIEDVDAISLSIDSKRHIRPYAPSRLGINNELFPTGAVNLDSGIGAYDDGRGIEISWNIRDYENNNEITSVKNESLIYDDFSGKNNTIFYPIISTEISGAFTGDGTLTKGRYNYRRVDPFSPPEYAFYQIGEYANTEKISRTRFLRSANGELPEAAVIRVGAQHEYFGSGVLPTQTYLGPINKYSSLKSLHHKFILQSPDLSGRIQAGLISGVEKTLYSSAPDNGEYLFEIGRDAFISPNKLEGRINAGSWQDIITQGNTTGGLGGVTAGDTISIRTTAGLPLTGELYIDELIASGYPDYPQNSNYLTEETILKVDAPAGSGAFGIIHLLEYINPNDA